MGTRIVRLLKILTKIGIMMLVMTLIILLNKKYMSNADGGERGCNTFSTIDNIRKD